VSRALWFLALLTAFVVAGARALCAFPASAAEERAAVPALSQAPQGPSEQPPSTNVTLEDDSDDDGADGLIAPAVVAFALRVVPAPLATQLGASEQQRALQSHAQALDRPPRVVLGRLG
jgi:hypothetical protein